MVYNGIIRELFEQFKFEEKVSYRDWIKQVEDLSPVHRLSRFIQDVLLVQYSDEKIFIFIDEIDKIFSQNISLDDFFSLIRSFIICELKIQHTNVLHFQYLG